MFAPTLVLSVGMRSMAASPSEGSAKSLRPTSLELETPQLDFLVDRDDSMTALAEEVRAVLEQLVRSGVSCSPEPLAQALNAMGLSAQVRSTSTTSSSCKPTSCLRRLHNEHVVAATPLGQELYVDPAFRSHFELPGIGSPSYQQLLERLPQMFVGSRSELVQMVVQVAPQMAAEFLEKGLRLPPWRTLEALLSRWPPPHALSNRQQHPPGSPASDTRTSSGDGSLGPSPTDIFSAYPLARCISAPGTETKLVIGFDIPPAAIPPAAGPPPKPHAYQQAGVADTVDLSVRWGPVTEAADPTLHMDLLVPSDPAAPVDLAMSTVDPSKPTDPPLPVNPTDLNTPADPGMDPSCGLESHGQRAAAALPVSNLLPGRECVAPLAARVHMPPLVALTAGEVLLKQAVQADRQQQLEQLPERLPASAAGPPGAQKRVGQAPEREGSPLAMYNMRKVRLRGPSDPGCWRRTADLTVLV